MAIPLAAAAVPVLGSLAAGAMSLIGGANQRAFDAAQAQKQMDFQERMSSTSWQRAVTDMKAAGLNPMLALDRGGASSPGGAMAAPAKNIVQDALSSAMSVVRLRKEMDLLKAQTWAATQAGNKSMADSLISNQIVQAYGQRLKGQAGADNVRNLLARLEVNSARNANDLQRAGYIGRIGGLDASDSLFNAIEWMIRGLIPTAAKAARKGVGF